MTEAGSPGPARVVLIAGPTASGKTSLAVELALALDGEIVNADSLQVYRGMNVGTAKPTLRERRGIPHHMLDVVNPDEPFNAALYREGALKCARDISARGKLCFVVGGTGLYFKALLGGLLRCPPADRSLRDRLAREWQSHGAAVLHGRLARADAESAARIHPNDRVRVLRALEVMELTSRRPSELAREHGFGESSLRPLKLGLDLERGELYRRIEARTERMVSGGLLAETRSLLERGYGPDLKPMKAIGYRHAIRHLAGEWSLEELTRNLQQDTRRYAKRQLTWFRSDPEMTWVSPGALGPLRRMVEGFIGDRS